MAFNFNWSPLTADADFYSRARDLLTAALNKTPKPPIIVDDILVDELNLGSVPPELEILEIGDLAEDRFRGIFKMCYRGDAFLTLKTRVQANPLNTYLDSKPAFTSPQPLAAASGLTIPLSITLSEIKLSAFIILVFSKQKGLTLVFRNDPLESLMVSSTFDSIQFVRDYLQRTIEGQLRSLMLNELPAIIHRLSLQFWCPDQMAKADGATGEVGRSDEPGADPFASPPLDPVDANGNLLDGADVTELSLNGSGEMQSLFSQKNLLHMSSLEETNKTFSVLTPSVREAVFRAWTSTSTGGAEVPTNPNSNKTPAPSSSASASHYCPSDASSMAHGHLPSRPSLVSLQSATTGLSLGSGSRSRSYTGRKKKTRVVNLRRTKTESETQSDMGDALPAERDNASMRVPISEPLASTSITEEPEEDEEGGKKEERDMLRPGTSHPASSRALFGGGSSLTVGPEASDELDGGFPDAVDSPQDYFSSAVRSEKKSTSEQARDAHAEPAPRSRHQHTLSDASTIQEHAWIMKMADEIARRIYDEQRRQQEEDDGPPPAYEATT